YDEQLENAIVLASNSSIDLSSSQMMLVYTIPTMSNMRQFITYIGPLIVQIFKVELNHNILTLCEFKLYEKECENGYFGNNCSHHCHCLDKKACNNVIGKCQTDECLTGWQGEACDTVCDVRTFGDGCKNTCNCFNGASCDNVIGTCFSGKCEPGWLLPTCSQTCQLHNFGDDCKSTCHCINKTACDHSSGHCEKELCDPGWLLPTCSKECGHRSFGQNCSSVCHCINDTNCNPVTGECHLGFCDPGWQTSSCDKIIVSNSVSFYCCLIDQLYQQLADVELYLANDTGQHSFHLVGNSTRRIDGNKHVLTFSNKLTRFIKIQRPGVLTLCEVIVSEGECQVGTFGEECSEICHCADERACDKTSGYCQSDACKSGWIGKSCNQECPKNRFGDRCSETCFCAEGTCTTNYGVCQNGCQQGYTGSLCNQDYNLIERIRANVTTNQSSTYSPSSNPQDFDSSKAIDGVQNYLVDTCKCCSLTHGALPSWWQIDLGQKYLLSSLQIFGRAAGKINYNYQLENATIYAGNVSIKTNMTLVYKVPSMTSTRNFTKELDAIIAQYFRVELNQRELTLCEFKLFGKECEIGYFGSGCLHSCHCSDNNKCDQVTGKCQTSGCLAGWTGEACEDDCPEGTFGLNCYGICNCKDDAECRKTDGFCSNGCAFGWSGFNCSKGIDLAAVKTPTFMFLSYSKLIAS
ncbi:multiple epidermal growth factor-like domains protein 6, partial [Ruditapes philippinarum]|uniref:multiple epidermal growth factor-like domains protein 6 n=1 Tax=Ruditapes philippinarum TaxID=129788 RepID=UPI00295C0D10